jgi:hypothetical protein
MAVIGFSMPDIVTRGCRSTDGNAKNDAHKPKSARGRLILFLQSVYAAATALRFGTGT